MAIIKCKMCGGDIELTADKTFGTCEFCGSTMTLPKIDDDQRAAAFNRGTHFRRIGEFDKALSVYERIVREDDTDAEAHWCCALCRFGIEYVEDPATFEWLPTCHRASFDSFLEDVDYKAAVEYSDGITKRQYMKDGAKIAEVQRGILATSQNAEPYDVFICYKESDENGQRTRDSLMAQDIYYQLTEQGRKVFFARITLEDVAGAQYEPYIFAALNSAKVMIVVGTKPEYLNAVWVKNEWSRFLAMMKKDRHKLLLPCYRDMDPYDMPEPLSVLQSYDMSKIGFIQDLTRGIAKVLDADKKPEPVKETVVMQQAAAGANTAPLLKRAFMFLEDGDWNSANEYCEKVLDIDPECAQAYIGKLMAELRVKKQGDLQHQAEPFDGRSNYQNALSFSDEVLKATLKGYIEFINTRNENTRLENEYISAKSAMKRALGEESYLEVAAMFERISGYKDSDKLAEECEGQAEIARKNSIYDRAKSLMYSDNQAKIEQAIPLFASIPGWRNADELKEQCPERAEAARKDSLYYLCRRVFTGEVKKTEENWKAAQQGFESIPKWRDADALAKQCAEQINKLKEEQARREKQAEEERIEQERRTEIARKEAERIAKRNKKIAIITTPIVCAIIAFIIVLNTVIIPIGKYIDAIALMHAGKYTEAISAFEALDGYKDSANKIAECNAAILDGKYNDAIALMDAGKLDEAYSAFIELGDYKDASEKAGDIRVQVTKEQLKNIKVGSYIKFGTYEQDNNTSNGKEYIEWFVLEVKDGKALVISKYALDCKKYNTSKVDVTWETSTLRKWLNNDFLNSAFSADEKAMIPTVTVSADKNPEYSTNPGKATQDQVFLLRITEAIKYLSSNNARQCKPTDYAVANGADVNSDNGNCQWWLRSPGDYQTLAARVYHSGAFLERGGDVNLVFIAVRPALWIDLND